MPALMVKRKKNISNPVNTVIIISVEYKRKCVCRFRSCRQTPLRLFFAGVKQAVEVLQYVNVDEAQSWYSFQMNVLKKKVGDRKSDSLHHIARSMLQF